MTRSPIDLAYCVADLGTLLGRGTLLALRDLLDGPGLTITPHLPGPLNEERVQVRLYSPRNPEYTFEKHLGHAVVAPYTFRMNTDRETEATDIQRTKGVAGLGSPGPISQSLAYVRTFGRTEGWASATTEAVRDTWFFPGPAGRYAGDLVIKAEVSKTWFPSHTAASFTPGFVKHLADRAVEHVFGQTESDEIRLRETVLVTESMLVKVDTPGDTTERPRRPIPRGVVELPPVYGQADLVLRRGGTGFEPLDVGREDLLERRVMVIGANRDRLAELWKRVELAGKGRTRPERPRGNMVLRYFDRRLRRRRRRRLGLRPGSYGVARLFTRGTLTRDSIRALFSYPVLVSQMQELVSENGLRSPILLRRGGLLTDTVGHMTMRVELATPRVLGHVPGWHEWSNYSIEEAVTDAGGKASHDVDLAPANPPGDLGGAGHITVEASRQATHVLKSQPNTFGYGRDTVKWLWGRSDAVVTVEFRIAHGRGLIRLPEKTWPARFSVPDVFDLMFSPEGSIKFGVFDPGGMPTPSGVYFPTNAAGVDVEDELVRMQAAMSFPPVRNALVVHASTTGAGQFVMSGRPMTIDQLIEKLKNDLGARVLVLHASSTAAGSTLITLAEKLQTPVIGATTEVRTTAGGRVIAYSEESGYGYWVMARQDGTVQSFERVQDVLVVLDKLRYSAAPLEKPVQPPQRWVTWGSFDPHQAPSATASPVSPSRANPRSATEGPGAIGAESSTGAAPSSPSEVRRGTGDQSADATRLDIHVGRTGMMAVGNPVNGDSVVASPDQWIFVEAEDSFFHPAGLRLTRDGVVTMERAPSGDFAKYQRLLDESGFSLTEIKSRGRGRTIQIGQLVGAPVREASSHEDIVSILGGKTPKPDPPQGTDVADVRESSTTRQVLAPTPDEGTIGVGRPAPASQFHRSFDGLELLVDAVASERVSGEDLDSGSADVKLVTFGNGAQAVYKNAAVDQPGVTPTALDLAEARRAIDAEQLASTVGRAIGAPVPRVYRTGDYEAYMEYVVGRPYDAARRRLGSLVAGTRYGPSEHRCGTAPGSTRSARGQPGSTESERHGYDGRRRRNRSRSLVDGRV